MAFLFYFDAMNYVVTNGKVVEKDKAALPADNRSYRYGDGLFETIKLLDGKILLKEYHFERLFSGLKTLKFATPSLFTEENIEAAIKNLCVKNNCQKLARVRLSVSRGNGGLYDCDYQFSWLVECWPLEQRGLNENGLVIDIFPDARKSIDAFSNLKSANYLPYVMAAVWAKEQKLNDALVRNSRESICDATIANVFWVKENEIFTPPLSEGCVDGVMRRRILDLPAGTQVLDFGFEINESVLTEEILLEADEVFLTNATSGIRWVGQFRNKKYNNRIASKLFTQITNRP
jgi:branched-chain amino acid aminotransferase